MIMENLLNGNALDFKSFCIIRIVNPMPGFKNFKSACSVISGIETFYMLKKGKVCIKNPIQKVQFINAIMNLR